ncbi:hypothetical protein ACLOJK_026204 [Asimina triloba]
MLRRLLPPSMADLESNEMEELSPEQKKDIAKWFLTHAPPGEIQYIAKDIRSILSDEDVYNAAASVAFPSYNKSHMISLDFPNKLGDVIITTFGEVSENEYLEPRSCQVATVDHVKQTCTSVRPATDEELPSPYIEEFRAALDAEISKYVSDTYPKGVCSVYCVKGKDAEGAGANFELAVVISAARHSPQNFCNGSWRSIWNVEFRDDLQLIELRGKMQVDAHYFEEGNVQLDAKHECKNSTIFQASYSNLPDTTFKDLRRKLPVTRTLFPWQSALMNRDIAKEIGNGK